MSEFTSKAKVRLDDIETGLEVERKSMFHDLLTRLGNGRSVDVIIRYTDRRQDWIDKWHSRAMKAESLDEVSFAFVKDGTVCIDCAQGNVFTVAAPRKGDKYDRKTGMAVAFAKMSGEKIPEYI